MFLFNAMLLIAAQSVAIQNNDHNPPRRFDVAGLAQILEELQSKFIGDIIFEYEGSTSYLREELQKEQGIGPDGLANIFTGVYGSRRNGESFAEYYLDDKTRRGRLNRFFLSDTAKKSIVYMKTVDALAATVHVNEANHATLDSRGSPGRLLLLNVIKEYEKMRYVLENLGTETVDGVECQVVAFHRPGAQSAPASRKGPVEKLWIDFQHGGHARKRERYIGANVSERMSEVVIERIAAGKGEAIWLPVSAKYEGLVTLDDKRKQVFVTDPPVYIEKYKIMPYTIKFNTKFSDRRFEPEYKSEDMINDGLQKMRYRFGSYRLSPRPSTKEVEEKLNELLRDGKNQGDTLMAGSRQRVGDRSWVTWLPWLLSGVSLFALIVVLYRRRAA